MLPAVTDVSKGMSAITSSARSLAPLQKYKGQDQAEARSLSYYVWEWMQTPQWKLTGYCASRYP